MAETYRSQRRDLIIEEVRARRENDGETALIVRAVDVRV